MHGYQADLDPTIKGMTGGLYDEREEGSLAQAVPEIDAALKKDDWNTYEISAIGDHIQLFINGIRSADVRHGRTKKGIIALQVHSGSQPVKVRWRNIRIQDLGDGGGWQPLCDGKTLKGWHVQGEPNAWRVEDGAIVGELTKESPYAYLATDETFSNFELKLKMRYESDSGNSGIFFLCKFPPQCAKCGEVARDLPADVKDFKCPKCGHDKSLPMRERVHIHGPQAEFAPQNTGGLYCAGCGGWINEDALDANKQKMHHLGEWNDFRLIAVGDQARVYLNGYLISDVKDYPFPESGIIALQLHAGGPMKVRFKDIQIRPTKKKRSEPPQ